MRSDPGQVAEPLVTPRTRDAAGSLRSRDRGVRTVEEGRSGSFLRDFRRRRRRRRILRQVAALVLVLLVAEVLVYDAPSYTPPAGTAPVGPVASVESGALPGLPSTFSSSDAVLPDMEQVWAAAVVQDPSPSLATFGETGTSGGKVALTFDDGPDPRVTPVILDTLREHDVRATFFVVGRYVRQYPEIVRRIVAEGHTLGNHTHSHASMSNLSAAGMQKELRKTQKAVNKALGYHHPMFVMRPPYGHPYQDGSGNLPLFQEVVWEQELFPVLWTPSPHDYLFDGRPGRIIRDIKRGRPAEQQHDEVLLLHDTKQQTADALPGVIEIYTSEDLEFTSVQQLLADKYLHE